MRKKEIPNTGEDVVSIIEITTQDLECHINLVDKAGLGRIDSNFEGSFQCG
jgi:hypothetical protein